jgi:Zn-finger nucleic acid-binding protein
MILACAGCDGRYDVTGYAIGTQFRCRCGTVTTLAAPSSQAGLLACPHCGAGVAPTAARCEHCAAELLLKACPRCLSRVFHGHKHCPECGAGLDIAAIGAAEKDHPCPRCETALRARLVGDVVIDECPSCLGLFLDHVAIQRVVTDRDRARADALLGALPKHAIDPRVRPGQKMYVKCPSCRTIMNRKQFAMGAGVVVDVCKGHGTFFDAGELPAIIEFVMQGGLEKAAKRELDREREQLRAERDRVRAAAADVARQEFSQSRRGAGGVLVDLLFDLFG